jgi:Mn-dependent DtxR family transcriptional regulator
MYAKRIEGLLETKLVDRKAEIIELTSKGERAATVLLAVHRFLRLEPHS